MTHHIAYIGAGQDINPQSTWKGFKFVLVDSCPATEFPPYYDVGFSRPAVAKLLRESSTNIEPLRTRRCCDPKTEMYQPHICELKNGNVYFASSAFPNRVTPELASYLKKCDKLYISGHFPPKYILEYLNPKKPITFYLIQGSSTYNVEASQGTIMEHLWEQKKGDVRIVVVGKDSIIKMWDMGEAYQLMERMKNDD